MSQRTDQLGNILKGAFSLAIIQQIGDTVLALGKAGRESKATAVQFTQMAGGAEEAAAMLDKMRDSTLNVVSDIDLMTGGTRLLRLGLAENSDEVAKFTELAVKLSPATMSAGDAIENLTSALANRSIERLDTLGVSSGKLLAKVKELQTQFQGMTKDRAWSMAFLELGNEALLDLGDSANIAGSNVNKVETAWANLRGEVEKTVATFQENAATGITFVLGINSQQDIIRDALAQQLGDAVQFATDTLANDATFNSLPRDFLSEYIRLSVETARNDPSLASDLAGLRGHVMTQLIENTSIPIPAGIEGPSGNILLETLSGRAMGAAGGVGAYQEQLAIQRELATAEEQRLAASQAVESTQLSINHLGQDAGVIFTNIGETILNWGMAAVAEDAAKLREELEGLSLSELFGQSDGGRLGGLSDMIGDAMEQLGKSSEVIHKFREDMDLLSGRDTMSSRVIETMIAPTIASTATNFGAAEAQRMATNLNDILNEAFMQGININNPAFLDPLVQAFNAADFSPVDPQQFIDSLDPLAEMEGSFVGMAEDGSVIENTMRFWGEQAPAIAEQTSATETAMKGIKTVMDEMSTKTYQLKITPELINVPALLAMLLPGLVQMVQSAGGIMPGTDQRASQSGTLVRQGNAF